MTDATETPDTDPTAQAVAEVIQRFGGIRPTAKAMRSPVTTVQGWKRRGHIPENRIPDLEAAATRKGITLERDLLVAATGGTTSDRSPATAAPTAETVAAGVQEPASSSETAPPVQPPPAEDTALPPAPADADIVAEPPVGPAPAAEPAATSGPDAEPAEPPSAAPATAEPEAPSPPTEAEPEPMRAETVTSAAPAAAAVPPVAASPAVPPRRGASGVAWFAVLLGLVSASAAATSPLWAPDLLGMPTADRLQRQIQTLEAQLAAADTGAAERTALAERVTALEDAPAPSFDTAAIETRLAALEAQPTPEPVDLGPLTDRLAALESQVDTLGTVLQTAADGGVTVDLAPLEDRLTALEATVAGLPDPTAAIASLREEIAAMQSPAGIDRAAVEALVADQLAGFSPVGVETAIATLQAEAAGRDARLADLEARLETVTTDLTAATEQMMAIGATLTDLDQAVRAAGAETAAMAETLRGEIDRVTLSTGPTQAFALAVSQLQEASRTGAPFPAAQATVQALAATDPALMTLVTPLAGPAADGVPTAASLASSFEATAAAIRQAVAENREGSWIDRSLSTVTSVVTIRRTSGEASGDSLDAVLDRTADRLEVGNVAGAIEALDGLDGPAADAATGWLADARDRVALDAAVAALTQEAITRLASLDG